MQDVISPQDASAPWALPRGWSWSPLAALCPVIAGGGTPRRERTEFFGGDIVWITPTDLEPDNPRQVITRSKTTLTEQGLASSSAKLVPAGAVLFSSRASIGKIAIAGLELCTNQGFANFVCGPKIDNEYLAWMLHALTEQIKSLAGKTTYAEVSRGKLRNFKIPVPFADDVDASLRHQRQTVQQLSALDDEIIAGRVLLKGMAHTLAKLRHNIVTINDANAPAWLTPLV
jgi:type I restriction enzyme, S subunit